MLHSGVSSDQTTYSAPSISSSSDEEPTAPAFTLGFSAAEPGRVGEVAWLEQAQQVLGRSGTLTFCRQRPSGDDPTGLPTDKAISREQLQIRRSAAHRVSVERVGRLGLKVNGLPTDHADLRPGDVLEIGDRLVLYFHMRPRQLPASGSLHAFGQPDQVGLVGESQAAWALRSRVAFVAERVPHALVRGPSGTGKELVARGLHQLSARQDGPWVSRSAATIPESLADAELFGNCRNYPNPGMPDRPGLIGEANGGTLFLDEFGELPIELQARLLRVLDAGEYTRLGEARARKASLRLVAATNRELSALKQDVLARLPLRITTPPLTERREDIGLLVRHLLRGMVRADPNMAYQLFDEGNVDGAPRVTSRLIATLIAHPYQTHIRELNMLLWEAISAADGGPLDLFPGYAELLDAPTEAVVGHVDPSALDPETIQASLDRNAGNQELTRKELGLSSRWVLSRLIRKHNLRVRGRRRGKDEPDAED